MAVDLEYSVGMVAASDFSASSVADSKVQTNLKHTMPENFRSRKETSLGVSRPTTAWGEICVGLWCYDNVGTASCRP